MSGNNIPETIHVLTHQPSLYSVIRSYAAYFKSKIYNFWKFNSKMLFDSTINVLNYSKTISRILPFRSSARHARSMTFVIGTIHAKWPKLSETRFDVTLETIEAFSWPWHCFFCWLICWYPDRYGCPKLNRTVFALDIMLITLSFFWPSFYLIVAKYHPICQ